MGKKGKKFVVKNPQLSEQKSLKLYANFFSGSEMLHIAKKKRKRTKLAIICIIISTGKANVSLCFLFPSQHQQHQALRCYSLNPAKRLNQKRKQINPRDRWNMDARGGKRQQFLKIKLSRFEDFLWLP